MKLKTLYRIMIIAIIILVTVIVLQVMSVRKPITVDEFQEMMSAKDYVVFDNYSLDEDAKYESKIVSFDSFKKPTEKWTAIFAGRSEVVFMTYETEEDALLTQLKYENEQRLQLDKTDFLTQEWKEKSGKINNSKGEHYHISYQKTLNEDFILIAQVENTLLVANIDKSDITEFNNIINKTGYRYL